MWRPAVAGAPRFLSAGTWLTSCGTSWRARVPGRVTQEGVTLFESMGVALEDIAAADLVVPKGAGAGHRPGVAVLAGRVWEVNLARSEKRGG